MRPKLRELGLRMSEIEFLTDAISPSLNEAERLAYLFHIEEPLHVPTFFGKGADHVNSAAATPLRGARLLSVWLTACRHVGVAVPDTNKDVNDTFSMHTHASLLLFAQKCLGSKSLHSAFSKFREVEWFEEALNDAIFEYVAPLTLKPVLKGATIDTMVLEEGPTRMQVKARLQSIPNSESMDCYSYGIELNVIPRGKSFLDSKGRSAIFQFCQEESNDSIFSKQYPQFDKRFTIEGAKHEWAHLVAYPRKPREPENKPTLPIFSFPKLRRLSLWPH